MKPNPEGVYDYQYVEIGGISQWVTIRGENPTNSVLILVHGGPGSPFTIRSTE
ncbi:hypothetical protein J14TS2_22030 [Bacillus sp. J14TS2]|uniref:hypothetical protein n=1 Tax=Bacillus sp. J14TS2 TaxID=2807188 RepID=UPI001B1EB765|nr:hypothetical protein [Bacillus sp. J14TS2]GIN71728.1 hypothetical protein J14TS2_22030 [Bacillus sp. J14TS2]